MQLYLYVRIITARYDISGGAAEIKKGKILDSLYHKPQAFIHLLIYYFIKYYNLIS